MERPDIRARCIKTLEAGLRDVRTSSQGDQCNAFFQYIVTTSTPPPDELGDDDHVRLHLARGTNTKVNPETGEEEDDGYLFGFRF